MKKILYLWMALIAVGNAQAGNVSLAVSDSIEYPSYYLGEADLGYRQTIVNFVEAVRTAYEKKDLSILEQAVSEDAMLLTQTGKDEFKKGKQAQMQYFENHKRIFFYRDKPIKVELKDVIISRHPFHPNFYGANFLLKCANDSYEDNVYFFQLWDFTNESQPLIHIQALQPAMLNGEPLAADKILGIHSFEF